MTSRRKDTSRGIRQRVRDNIVGAEMDVERTENVPENLHQGLDNMRIKS